MTKMAILQDVDRCMRCNGCVISCKRTWQMKALNPGIHKTAPDQRVVIKSQKRVDMGPFVRYSCWHCENPPCATRCPFKAVVKQATGAVSIDPTLCNPGATNPANGKTCAYQCQTDCGRGGYPKVGAGSDQYGGPKSYKCTMCHGRAGDIDSQTQAVKDEWVAKYGNPLSTNYNTLTGAKTVAETDHEPACVYTCPAKAMTFDSHAAIKAYLALAGNGFVSAVGDGSMYWGSRKTLLVPPKADPFMEDHVTPLVSSVLSSPFAKAALVPTLLAGGLMAVIARRQRIASEMGEV
jgi:Fe-S-cluster-containing dehydrogenase component